MSKRADTFTTGQAAKLCRVSQQTIIRMFDTGHLVGFKVPGSKFRRITRESLLTFMRAHGIPTDRLTAPESRLAEIDRELAELAAKVRELTAEREELSAANSAPATVEQHRVNRLAVALAEIEDAA